MPTARHFRRGAIRVIAESIAVVGRGRFGGALAMLLERAGVSFTSHDVHDPPPPDSATLVVLAVPLAALATAAARAPAGALLVDVTSVKVAAERVLAQQTSPYCATHPLFGPASVNEARPLSAVVCPNAAHPASAARTRAFYERLGVHVRELDAASHDRVMAETQALAFFLGEGLRAAELPQLAGALTETLTPSAETLTRLAGNVTREAPHVTGAIMEHNPYAAGARERLLAALRTVHVARDVASVGDDDGLLDGLAALRGRIDRLDAELLSLLATRAHVATEISRAKERLQRPVRDAAREQAAIAERRARGEALGVDGAFVEALFVQVMHWSRAVQERDRHVRRAAPTTKDEAS